ncbi:uncharacterized protein C11orf71 homolog [Carlito syrichta]|uniref:Uncharacterized protein C11orf71 homolog n=1 Tax=Carlito syrichta TaxID=1868482 RepID=A0A1U7SKU8_CARSF|nr:uncharacterized protein C11orf71 homolog [Carlito syrichta]
MASNGASLSAGDRGNRVASRSSRDALNASALALAMVSGDSCLVARPEGTLHAGPWPAVRLSLRSEIRRASGSGRSPACFMKGREPDARTQSRQARFTPYRIPERKADLLRSVLQQRLLALGSVIAAQILF